MRDYIPLHWQNCPVDVPMKIDLKMPKSNTNNTIRMNGTIYVSEKIIGEIDFILENNRCNLNLTSCEHFQNQNIPGICKMLKTKNAFYSKGFEGIKPQLFCPFEPGNYTIDDATFDVTLISMMPIDGYVWVTTFKLAAVTKGSKKKRLVMCANSETKVVKRRIKS